MRLGISLKLILVTFLVLTVAFAGATYLILQVAQKNNADLVQAILTELAKDSKKSVQDLNQGFDRSATGLHVAEKEIAKGAEKSSTAVEEMNTQAGKMKRFVDDLICLVNGNEKGERIHPEGRVFESSNG